MITTNEIFVHPPKAFMAVAGDDIVFISFSFNDLCTTMNARSGAYVVWFVT